MKYYLLLYLVLMPAAFADCERNFSLFAELRRFTWTAARLERALEVMQKGSLNVSRSKVNGRVYFGTELDPEVISAVTEERFMAAARYLLEKRQTLPLNEETATQLNYILTRDTVPDGTRGNSRYRESVGFGNDMTDPFVKGDPDNFYRWLESPEARQLESSDPVALAELVHYNIAALDAFPDANGRLSRLFADLILIRNGYAPAFYTDMEDYFARGSFKAPVSREQKKRYFREAVLRGQAAIKD